MGTRRVNFQIISNNSGDSDRPNGLDNPLDYNQLTLYPLDELLQELVQQEKQIWQKNHGVHIPIEDEGSQLGVGIDDEMISIGGSSVPSHGSQASNEATMTYLIRYGQLTKVIHRYFRKLEKEHACLYLSGRRANFDNLRLHLDPAGSNRSTPVPSEEDSTPAHSARRNIHSLRDEELFVYRCAIMCAQFPMLSAPSPPDDRSPSPPFPPLLSQTAPSESSVLMGTLLTPLKLTNNVSETQKSIPNGGLPHTQTEQLNNSISIPNQPTDSIPIPRQEDLISSQQADSVPQTDAFSNQQADSVPQTDAFSNQPTDSISEPILSTATVPQEEEEPTIVRQKKGKEKVHKAGNGDNKKITRRASAEQRRSQLSDDDSDYETDEIFDTLNKKLKAIDPFGRDQPFPPMVNRDMLCALVRRAFHQTEEQQIQYEQILRHEYGRKSKGEILARELVAQLQVLENNAHPFYKTRNFVTRNGYDIWLQSEKQRIRDQLDKFWHYNLPRPQTWSQFAPADYHKAYTTLLENIICCESRSTRREPVHGGRTPSAPLSATAVRLLTEFGLRYGIGELYRKTVYLDYLAKHFDYEIWYIKHCTEELKSIRSVLPKNKAKMTATRREMDMLRSTVHLLHGQTDNSLTRIDRLFQDSDPQLGVAALIDLLKEVLDTEQSLFNQRVRPIEEWLKRYLKAGFALRYERKKEIIADEIFTARNIVPFNLTPILVNALLLAIREEVARYRDLYQPVFRKYFNIVPFAKLEFYRLICSDACSLCGRMIHDPASRQRLNLEMLGLLYRLNERDLEWSNIIPTEMQRWRNEFVHLALIWMDVLAKQINHWVLLAIREDQWTILTFASPVPGISSTTSLDLQSTNYIPVVQTQISPFPTTISGSPLSLPSTLIHHPQQSAFTPVEPVKRYGRALLSPMSEASGGITDVASSHSSFESLSLELQKNEEAKRSNNKDEADPVVLKFGKASGGTFQDDNNRESDCTLVPGLAPPLSEEDNDTTPLRSPIDDAFHDEFNGIDNGLQSLSSSSVTPPIKMKSSPTQAFTRVTPIKQGGALATEPMTIKTTPSKPPQISVVRNLSDSYVAVPASTTSPSDSPSSSARPTPAISLDGIHYVFPISNSPIDLITIYLRLASFVGSILNVLTFKMRQGFKPPGLNEQMGEPELPSEVMQARRLMNDIQHQTENVRTEFLKKIHMIMVSSLKHYADNLLCMDLCCLPQYQAEQIVGRDMLNHLQLKNETGDIWGCRHCVEANYGLYPNGMPCLKKSQQPFESITRDMCIRINNIHMLLSVFQSLESSVYTATLSPSYNSPFGINISSEASSGGPRLGNAQLTIKTQAPFPHRFRPESHRQHHQQPLELISQETLTSSDFELGMTPLSRRKFETGFQSVEAQQLMSYLEDAQQYQLHMICTRMDRFFKPALSFLLNLRLGNCSIDRRLRPLVTFFERHAVAFKNYLYPKCYKMLMELLWKFILRDLEEEVLNLIDKRLSPSRAHLLLQTITHFIKVVHNQGNGLPLDILTLSTEYVLALLDIFLQPTEKLIKAFRKLNGPQFTQNQVTLDSSPVPLSAQLIHSLNLSLHKYNKCFTGQEFVEELLKLTVQSEARPANSQNSSELNSVTYTVTSAIQLGQYLLDEGILICLFNTHMSDSPLNSSSTERINAVNTTKHANSDIEEEVTRPESNVSTFSSTSPTPVVQPPQFSNDSTCQYKFSDLEDSNAGAFYQRAQVLSISFAPRASAARNQQSLAGGLQMSEFDQARFGTLFLIIDVLKHRSRKEKAAKVFLQRPQVEMVSQQRAANHVSCQKIFRT